MSDFDEAHRILMDEMKWRQRSDLVTLRLERNGTVDQWSCWLPCITEWIFCKPTFEELLQAVRFRLDPLNLDAVIEQAKNTVARLESDAMEARVRLAEIEAERERL